MKNNNFIIAKKYISLSALALVIILMTFYFYITALSSPFFNIHYPITSLSHLFKHTDVLTFWNYIDYLAKIKLKFTAKIFIIFSVIIPFIKLLLLFCICFIIKKAKVRYWVINIIQFFDKWALISIFTFLILFFTRNSKSSEIITPEVGIYYFILATLLGILASMLVDTLCVKADPKYFRKTIQTISFSKKKLFFLEKLIILLCLSASFIFYVLSLISNYIYVSVNYLVVNQYSLISCWLCIQNTSHALALFSALTLIVIPFIVFNDLFIFWSASYYNSFHYRITNLVKNLSRFMMLDVFLVSMILFYVEGKDLIHQENKLGIRMLILFLILTIILPLSVRSYCLIRNKLRVLIKRNSFHA